MIKKNLVFAIAFIIITNLIFMFLTNISLNCFIQFLAPVSVLLVHTSHLTPYLVGMLLIKGHLAKLPLICSLF